ncbi:MAG: C40 family peptidase, partial [Acidobacteria bacterium]|nr:C40 family peptidase [Acidobacteriota bacterium]
PGQARPTTTDKTQTSLVTKLANSRPILTNQIVVAEQAKPLVQKTVSAAPLNSLTGIAASKMVYGSTASTGMMRGIQTRLGIPYRYGSDGPTRYDCSGFVWAVFRDAGIGFERQSARGLWTASVPVNGDERYRFGTLVFLNRLGHIGIVADENGFYHASSSKGITYSPFKGYWEKRIVGFRRLPTTAPAIPQAAFTAAAAK